MKLVVGLGNPGEEYSNTRHNIGFIVVDGLAEKYGLRFKFGTRYHHASYKNRAVLLKPQTYMNLSGTAVTDAQRKFTTDDLIVIYDDIYLPLGEIRIREKGSDGGHNGIKSIIDQIGHGEFSRMRIGIGTPSEERLSDYVLAPFLDSENRVLQHTKDFCIQLLKEFISQDYKGMNDYYSKRRKTYSGKISEYRDQRPKEDTNEVL